MIKQVMYVAVRLGALRRYPFGLDMYQARLHLGLILMFVERRGET